MARRHCRRSNHHRTRPPTRPAIRPRVEANVVVAGLLPHSVPRNTLPDLQASVRLRRMKTLTVSEVARRFGEVLEEVEREQEEIILVRNRRQVARLVPEPPQQNALEVFGDLA